MIQIKCPSCGRNLRVDDRARGKSIRCVCGESMTVPNKSIDKKSSAKLNSDVSTDNSIAKGHYIHVCECGRKLRVAQSQSLRRARCVCGRQFSVPALQTENVKQPVQPTIPVAKPVSNESVWSVPIGFDSYAQAPNVPYAGSLAPTYGASIPSTRSSASPNSENTFSQTYISQAERESFERPEAEHEGFWDGTALGGLAMMIIAVVWFVLGLMADYIFFYPPVLFVIGLITFVKALLD